MRTSAKIATFLTSFALLGLTAQAFDTSHLPYSDNPSDLQTRVALSYLTEGKVILGNPDGTFRPNSKLNRAEFMEIAMRLLPPSSTTFTACFVDVPKDAWYSQNVCRAKAMGIVSGNAYPDRAPEAYPFEPSRNVKYEEVLKVLSKIYSVPLVGATGQWYQPYYQTAVARGLSLTGLVPGDSVTRAEMVRLVAAYKTDAEGTLSELRDAQAGRSSSSSSSKTSSSSSSSSSVSSGSGSSGVFDPNRANLSAQSQFALLGQTSPVLAGTKIFLQVEPLDVRKVTITLASAVSSIDSFEVYDQNSLFLGTATLDSSDSSNKTYVLNLSAGTFVVPQATERSIYVRARLRSYLSTGVGGQELQITSVNVQGTGAFSTSSYTANSTDTYNTFQIARARITTIENAGQDQGVLVAGSQVQIGSFRFQAEESDASASARLTSLTFTVDAAGVTLSNVKIVREGTSSMMTCTVSGMTVTCSPIDESLGTLDTTSPVTLTLYGDVSINSGATNASLRLRLNDPGTTTTPGAIAWTDGSTNFTWVGGFTSPVAGSTTYRQ